MVSIEINANAIDESGLPVTLSAAVTSNEPQEGLGDGDKAPDWTAPVINQQTGVITCNCAPSGRALASAGYIP